MSKLTGKTVAHITLGCKVNMYDTQGMIEILENHGARAVDISERATEPAAESADIYIINTCTVTNLGDKKSRQAIRKVSKWNPDAVIVVCGCYSQIDPEAVRAIEGVDIVLGTKDRQRIAEFICQYLESQEQKNYVGSVDTQTEFEDLSISEASGKARAYIKIQEGCDNYCAYCIIPYARGRVRSRAKESILTEAIKLTEVGVQEIVLAGINIGNYGKDKVGEGPSLSGIIRELHEIQGIRRIRLGSIDPNSITDEFLKALSDCPKLCDHLHLSLQSGADKTLNAMNRHYSASHYSNMVAKLRAIRPNIGITTDVIVGFPGENEDDFTVSYDFVKAMEFSGVHVFPYSSKIGTKAASMDGQVPSKIKNERAKIMGELSHMLCEKFAKKFVNTKIEVLFEQGIGNNVFEGHTSNYIVVRCDSEIDLRNQIKEVECVYDREGCLYGK